MKLSLPAVEVMISLSNLHMQQNTVPEKKIAIKPLHVIQKANNSSAKANVDRENEMANINDALQQARQELQQIKRQKEQLLQETEAAINDERKKWETEKQAYIEEAKREGFNAGLIEGKEEGKAQYRALIEKANACVEASLKDYDRTIAQSDEMIVELAVRSAEKIIKQHLSQHPESFVEIVKAAINELKDHAIVSIFLHPNNYEYVLKQKDELRQLIDTETRLAIYVKDDLEENGCVIEYPYGQIDASVDTQLEQIRAALQEKVMEKKQ